MQWLLIPFVLFGGMCNAFGAGSNTALNKRLGQPFASALAIYLGGAVVALIGWGAMSLAAPAHAPPVAGRITTVPWWGWLGGVFGSVYILSNLTAASKLGAGVFTAASVTAAVVTALVLDHFGWMGFEQHSAGIGRIAGAALMIGGLACIARS